jgi:hypothetical protein
MYLLNKKIDELDNKTHTLNQHGFGSSPFIFNIYIFEPCGQILKSHVQIKTYF